MRRALTQATLAAVVTVLLVLAVEGAASVAAVLLQPREPFAGMPERTHTRFDAELGWSHIPGVHIADLYGKGVSLRINSQGFRADHDFPRPAPGGKMRMICSGDSFALGFGVGDDETWCRELERLNPEVETVNMGQAAYGLDQAYLWYLRDGHGLEHHAHLFTFINDDFRRMSRSEFAGYAKPQLETRDGQIHVLGTPLPEPSQRTRFENLTSLHAVQWLRRWIPAVSVESQETERMNQVAIRVFENLAALHRQEGRALWLIYLPEAGDYLPNRLLDDRRDFLRRETAARKLPYFDFTPDLRALREHEMRELFIPPTASLRAIGGAGHYTVKGNQWIARWMQERLELSRLTGKTP